MIIESDNLQAEDIYKVKEGKVNALLVLGECLEQMKKIPDKSIDCIICDLPYGVLNCHEWDKVIPIDELFKEYARVLKICGNVLLFNSEPFGSYLRIEGMKHIPYKYEIIWNKKRCGAGGLLRDHQLMKRHENIAVFYYGNSEYLNLIQREVTGKSKELQELLLSEMDKLRGKIDLRNKNDVTNSNLSHSFTKSFQFRPIGEDEFYKIREVVPDFLQGKEEEFFELLKLHREEKNTFKNTFNIDEFRTSYNNKKKFIFNNSALGVKKDKPCYTTHSVDINSIIEESVPLDGLHPTRKPVKLLQKLVKLYSNKGDVILDNTMGSGSTGEACMLEGRRFIGIELTKEYYDIAREQVKNAIKERESKEN